MHLSVSITLLVSSGLAVAIPFGLVSRDIAQFEAGSSWDIVLSKSDIGFNLNAARNTKVQAIDIDLFDTDSSAISNLKYDKKVICYFSAGSREDWRKDAGEFKKSDYKTPLDGWPGEHWVDIKSQNVRNIMKKRIKEAADKGCDAVDPDNVDGYSENQDKYGYKPADYANYIRELAAEAKTHNLAFGLKNAVEIIPQVVDVIQFAVNEECHANHECDQYKPLTDRNLAVFNIEYGGSDCSSPPGVKLSVLIKPEDQSLSTLGSGGCPNSNQPSTSPPVDNGNKQEEEAKKKKEEEAKKKEEDAKKKEEEAKKKEEEAKKKKEGGKKNPGYNWGWRNWSPWYQNSH